MFILTRNRAAERTAKSKEGRWDYMFMTPSKSFGQGFERDSGAFQEWSRESGN